MPSEPSRPLGRTTGSGSFALENSSRERGILRTGDSLHMRIGEGDVRLEAERLYRFRLSNTRNGATLSEGDVVTYTDGTVPPTTLAHDVGEGPNAEEQEGDTLLVELWDSEDARNHLESFIPLFKVPNRQGGWNVTEVDPPHVFAADLTSAPSNSFAVSDDGVVDPGEIGGAVYVGGEGFPEDVTAVDAYLVRDRDVWQNTSIPKSGEADWLAGPIEVVVTDGVLSPTAVWTPTLDSVGVYDVVVDVDRNGTFDWTLSNKDAADGEFKVGVTVQYSQAWVRARRLRHIIMNLAYGSPDREGTWRNVYGAEDELYVYTNPDVTVRPDLNHRYVYKWILPHQDFDGFWNNRALENERGCIPMDEINARFRLPPQRGCTNAPPLHMGRAGHISGEGTPPGDYDVVMTFGEEGVAEYCPGVDILDIYAGDETERLVTDVIEASQQYGFRVQ